MTVNLLSVQFVDFTPSNSSDSIHGCKLWFTRDPLTYESDRWSDCVVAYRWVDASDNLFPVASSLKPGITDLKFDTDGRRSSLVGIEQ